MIHELKTLPQYFNAVVSGEKYFEVRKLDRPFRVGDLLALNEYDGEKKAYTGRCCVVYVDYILDDATYCKSGYVTMSVKPCSVMKHDRPINMQRLCADYAIPLAPLPEVN